MRQVIATSFFNAKYRIYSPVQKCLRKMNIAEKNDYASQLSDYVTSRESVLLINQLS